MTQNIETTAIIQPWARAAYPNRSMKVNSAFCCLWDGEMSIFPAKQGRRTGGGHGPLVFIQGGTIGDFAPPRPKWRRKLLYSV